MSGSITAKVIEEFENLPRIDRLRAIRRFYENEYDQSDSKTRLEEFIEWSEWLLERAQKMLNSKIAAAKLGVP